MQTSSTHPLRSRCVRLLAIAALALLPGTAANAQKAAYPLSDSARAYLAEALDSLQATSLHRASVNWQQVRDSAFIVAAGAVRRTDTYGAIEWALRRVDKHSFLQARRGRVNPELLDGRVGYLRVPFYAGPSETALTDTLQSALRTLEGAGACGWIVDLRMNGGGNVWPMQAGIGPLLGDSVIGRGLLDGREDGYTLYLDGAAIAVEADGTRQEIVRVADPYRMRNPNAPVAVLIDNATASSAEAIALAFRPRANTRFFGLPTAGYSTSNRGVALPDGGNMVVTVGVMADRNGRGDGGPIQPHERIENPAGAWPHSNDVVARRARAWVGEECGRAGRKRSRSRTRTGS